MNYIDILNDKRVIDGYNAIDKINPYPFNHGLNHVKNVCKIMNNICDTLSISDDEREALLIASALHDIGQVDGREEHGKKAMIFTINNFSNELKDMKYYNEMLSAIEVHDHTCEVSNPLFTLLVQFCDKMDFSKDRLEENYRDRFRYYCYEDIEKIDFIYDDEYFGIDIITNNIDNFEEQFLNESFSSKVINATNVLAAKLNRKVIFKNNGNQIIKEVN